MSTRKLTLDELLGLNGRLQAPTSRRWSSQSRSHLSSGTAQTADVDVGAVFGRFPVRIQPVDATVHYMQCTRLIKSHIFSEVGTVTVTGSCESMSPPE